MRSISSKYLSIGLLSAVLLITLASLTFIHISHFHFVQHKILVTSKLMSVLHEADTQIERAVKNKEEWPQVSAKLQKDIMPEVEKHLRESLLRESLWLQYGIYSHQRSDKLFAEISRIWFQEIKPKCSPIMEQQIFPQSYAEVHQKHLIDIDRMTGEGVREYITEVHQEDRRFYNSIWIFLVLFGFIFAYIIYYVHAGLINPILTIHRKIGLIKTGMFDISFDRQFDGELGDLAGSITEMAGTINNLFNEQKNNNKKARIFNEIIQNLASSYDLEEMLKTAIEQAKEILGADYAAISLLNNHKPYSLFIPAGIDDNTLQEMKEKFGMPQGNGLLGHLLVEGKAILLNDIKTHPASIGFPAGHPEMKSFLGVPIILAEKVIGRIYFANRSDRPGFHNNDLELATSLASSAALAVNNINLIAELRVKTEELTILNRVSSAVSRSLDKKKIATLALQEIMQLETLQAEKQGAIFLFTEGEEKIKLAAHQNFPDELAQMDMEVPMGDCLCGLVAKERKIILSTDSCNDKRHTRTYTGMTCHGHICLPLKTGETLHGVINFYLEAGTNLSQAQVDHFKAMADIIAMALHNADSHERAEKLAKAVENSGDAVYISDLDRKITYCNKTATVHTGYKEDELCGNPITMLLSPRNPENLDEQMIRASMAGGWEGELIARRKDGSEYISYMTISPILDEKGAVVSIVGTGRDITARKEAEDALKTSEARLARAQAIAQLGNWEWDIVNNTTFWSDETYRIFGHSPQQFAGTYEAFLDSVHPGDREYVKESVRKALEEKMNYSIDHRIVLPDRSVRIVHEQAEVEFGPDNTPLKMSGTVQDITERKENEETLRKLSERLSLATRSAGLGIWDWDIKNDILTWDELMYRLYGLSSDSFGNEYEAWLQSIHLDDRQRVKQEIKDALENRTQFNSQFRIVWPGGKTIRTVRGVATAHFDKKGNPYRMIGVHQDITKIIEAEEKIQQSEEKFRRLVENLEDTYFFYSLEPNGIFTYISPSITTILGFTPIEYLQHFSKTITDHPINKNVLQHRQNSIEGTRQPPYLVEVYHKDGSRKWLEVKETPVFNKRGKVISIEGIAQDITERKKAEEELEWHRNNLEELVELRTNELEVAKRMAESANQAKSDFLANMSHELRTPLNAIIGFSDLMGRGMAGELTDTQKEYIDDISTSGKHLLSLINDILDLSKVEAGKMELDLTEFRMCELVKQSLIMFKEKSLKHNITLTVEGNKGLPPVTADERKVKQVLFNLLSNAFKYTPDGGHVTVDIGQEVIDTEEYIQVAVIDDGVGIPPAEQETIFQPFKQVDHYLTKKHKGTGLGLSLCKRFVELHGGEIRVESEPDQGSSFIFTLPVKQNRPLEYHL
jgi:PAS domain S-box-containing protein